MPLEPFLSTHLLWYYHPCTHAAPNISTNAHRVLLCSDRYTAFANNLETALATINECRRQPSFVLCVFDKGLGRICHSFDTVMWRGCHSFDIVTARRRVSHYFISWSHGVAPTQLSCHHISTRQLHIIGIIITFQHASHTQLVWPSPLTRQPHAIAGTWSSARRTVPSA